jgi:hypothetical protein
LLKKSKSKFLLASIKLLTNFENHFTNPLQRPYSGDFDPEKAYRELLKILLNHTESRSVTSKFWRFFNVANAGLALANIGQSQCREF